MRPHLPPLSAAPVVSLVIPVYNGGTLLRASIDCVLGQDYPHVELIVIDDGSTDGTREVLASYGNRFWWDSQANAGQAATLNRGIARAAGDIIGYLGADDLLAPGAVSSAVAALRACPTAIMSYCDFATIDIDGRETGLHRLPDNVDLPFIARKGFSPFGPGSFVRRAAALAVQFDPALRRVPDFDYSLRMARLGPLVRIPSVLAYFRVHEQSTSFAAPPLEVTEEAIHVVDRFFAAADLPPDVRVLEGEARAMAHISSAQGHFRARRWGHALRCCIRAVRLHPEVARTPFVYQLILSGLVGQYMHRRHSRALARKAVRES